MIDWPRKQVNLNTRSLIVGEYISTYIDKLCNSGYRTRVQFRYTSYIQSTKIFFSKVAIIIVRPMW